MNDFTRTWRSLLWETIYFSEHSISPNGKPTFEVLHRTIDIDMRKPVLVIPSRKLSYTFMLAEAHWILTGDNRVKTIEPYNKHISQFSDDGETFFGAYGPKILNQISYVANELIRDPCSRRAGLNIWRENPPSTKDTPCTVSIFFTIRDNKLAAHVFMRSSDIWLGLPYDVFTFSMLAHLVCAIVNKDLCNRISPGSLYLTAASSHLYLSDLALALQCSAEDASKYKQNETPDLMHQDADYLIERLGTLKNLPPSTNERWWVVV